MGVVVVLAILMLGAGCGSADPPFADAPITAPTTTPADLEAALDPTCVAALPVDPGTTVHTVRSGGAERSYLQYVPATYEGVAMPVVVSLHDAGSSAAAQAAASGLHDTADADGFIVLTPQGVGEPPGWDTEAGSDDVAFIADMVDQAQTDFCLDQRRVYVVGAGEGAGFAGRLACDESTRVAAVALLGSVDTPSACDQQRLVPLVAVLPDAAPPAGLTAWAERYGCGRHPQHGELSVYYRYRRCDDGAAVDALLFGEGWAPDTWPPGGQTTNDLLWAFFVDHPLMATS